MKCSLCNQNDTEQIGLCQECKIKLKISQITPHMYLTNYKNSMDYTALSLLGIKQILTVGNEMIHRTEELKTMYIPIDDCVKVNIMKHFNDAHEFIKQDKTVVHCYAGISRSPTIVISFLMKHHNMSLQEAYDLCKIKRPIIDPNNGFLRQLKRYEKMLNDYESSDPEEQESSKESESSDE